MERNGSGSQWPAWATTPTLAWVTLGANVVVILQGAFVRATGSGAGCGSHWPTCHGELVPLSGDVHTAIEFSHRLLSLVVLLLGAWLARRVWRERHEHRGAFVFGLTAFVFLLIEALLGALTVLWGLTGDDQSTARGVMVATHLVNSLFLVGALAATVVYARPDRPRYPLHLGRQGPLLAVLLVGLVGMQVLMFSGGIAAMGNTMFPSESLAEGIAADFDPESHPLIRLRILHPLIAIAVGVYLFLALGLARWLKPVREGHRLRQWLLGTYLVQLLIGTVNLALLAPIALQLLHLAFAVLAFGLLVALSVVMLGAPVPVAAGASPWTRGRLERA
jgi:heme A synthase